VFTPESGGARTENMQKHPQSTKICDVFLQQTVFMRLCVTQITKIGA
jgi:hypothetical protein